MKLTADDVFLALESDPLRLVNLIQSAQVAVRNVEQERFDKAQAEIAQAEVNQPPTLKSILDPRRRDESLTPEESEILVAAVSDTMKDVGRKTAAIDRGANLSIPIINRGDAASLYRPEDLVEAVGVLFKELVRDGIRSSRNATWEGRLGTICRSLWEIQLYIVGGGISRMTV